MNTFKVRIHTKYKTIEEHEITNPKPLYHLIKKIQFSDLLLSIIKSQNQSITVRWDMINGYEIKLKNRDRIFNDSMLFPSRMKVFLVLKKFLAEDTSLLVSDKWVAQNSSSVKSKLKILLLTGIVIFFFLTFLPLMYPVYDMIKMTPYDKCCPEPLNWFVISGLGAIFFGICGVLIYFKFFFYYRDGLQFYGNSYRSIGNTIYLASITVIIGAVILVAGMLKT